MIPVVGGGEIKKRRYLNKPGFRPISVKGLTGFSYGQDDPLHGRAQHHLPQEGTNRQKGERKGSKEEHERTGEQHAEESMPCAPWSASTAGQVLHPFLCTRTALPSTQGQGPHTYPMHTHSPCKLFLCILCNAQMTKYVCLKLCYGTAQESS